jgi:hypothetical protein
MCRVGRAHLYSVVLLVLTTTVSAHAQGPSARTPQPVGRAGVPHLIQVGGTLTDPAGQPIAGAVSIVLSVYADMTGGAPLFTELQIVTADARGRFSTLLGVTTAEGVPLPLFTSADARWLGIQPSGQAELPRALIISVPYALKAADAETLGGLPVSAFQRVDERAPGDDEPVANAAAAPGGGGGGTEKAARWQATTAVGPGFIADAVSGPPLQVASSEVVPLLNVDMLDGFHASAFARLATPNIFAGNQTVNGDIAVSGALIGRVVAVSSVGDAIRGEWAPVSPGFGVVGRTASTNGGASGVYGVATAAVGAGSVHGVYGETLGSVGSAVRGLSRQNGLGVEGLAQGTTGGVGVRGHAFSTAGQTVGVDGIVESRDGTAVAAWARSLSGATAGLRARVDSPGGIAGRFDGVGGDLLVGQTSNTPVFRVGGDGSVFATTYRNLAGTIVGTGTVTEVSAGTGLSGGPVTTAGSLSLDTAFTDARYAPSVHGHTVDQVAGAATLGPNAFVGDQAVTGLVNVTGSVYGIVSTTNPGVLGQSSGANGLGVRGTATGAGETRGVLGFANSPTGTGVEGESVSLTGSTVGVLGKVVSPDGVAVLGQSLQNNGTTVAVKGTVNSPTGSAGLFDNTAGGTILSGRRNGVEQFRVDGAGNIYASGYRDLAGNPIPSGTGDITAVSAGTGLSGGGSDGDVSVTLDTGYTDLRYALLGHGHTVGQVAGAATLGANAFSGSQSVTGSLSVSGAADVEGGLTAFGGPTKPNAVGVRGETTSGTAEGVLGVAISTTGRGARGLATGTGGVGVKGEASADSGSTAGVLGAVASPMGVAGLFENSAGGDLVRGMSAGTQVLRVDGSGAVYAASYRDLAGNPIPAGTGDITAVTPGAGLSGGGAGGDVSLALDTGFTDARYALLGHAHTVSQVVGAATLNANTFTGNQQVTGTLAVSGSVSAESASLSTSTGIRTLNVAHQGVNGVAIQASAGANSGSGIGVQGSTSSTNGTGVLGQAGASTGSGTGVRGVTFSASGTGVYGQVATSAGGGVAVFGAAASTTGTAIGVFGTSSSPAGIAGVFDNGAGGRILVGQANGVHRFRVSANGTVEAVEYRDMAGNLIGQQGPAGPEGPEGPAGPQGLQGPMGLQGTAGVSGYEVVFGSSAYASVSSQSFPLACPAGKVPVGGGGQVAYEIGAGSGPLSAVITGSFPSTGEGNVWRVQASEVVDTDRSWRLNVWVICTLTTP